MSVNSMLIIVVFISNLPFEPEIDARRIRVVALAITAWVTEIRVVYILIIQAVSTGHFTFPPAVFSSCLILAKLDEVVKKKSYKTLK